MFNMLQPSRSTLKAAYYIPRTGLRSWLLRRRSRMSLRAMSLTSVCFSFVVFTSSNEITLFRIQVFSPRPCRDVLSSGWWSDHVQVSRAENAPDRGLCHERGPCQPHRIQQGRPALPHRRQRRQHYRSHRRTLSRPGFTYSELSRHRVRRARHLQLGPQDCRSLLR